MKLTAFLIIILFTSGVSNGQDDITGKDDSLQRLLRGSISDSLKVNILEQLHFLWKNKSFARSIEYSKQSIEFSEKHKLNATGLKYQLGFAYMEAGDAVRSLDILHQLAKEMENENPSGYCLALAFIAMNYENQGEIKKALEYQLKASSIYENLFLKDSTTINRRGLLGNPHKMAVYYLKNNQLDSALSYIQKALDRLKTEPLNDYNRFFSWYIKTAAGDIYSRLNQFDKAMNYYAEAEGEAIQYNYRMDLLPVYLGRSKIYYQKGELQSALIFAKKAYQLADSLKVLPMVKESALFIKAIYSDLKIPDSSLHYYEAAIAAKDSMFNADIARKIDAMEFGEEKRVQELKIFQQERSFQKKQFYFIIGILLSVLFALFFYQKNRLKQKANQLLEYEKKEIFQQRDQLQREVESFEMQALKAQLNPHFIFNCLNSIDAFIYSNDKYKATMYLNKFAKLLRNILDSSKNNTVSITKDIQSLQLYTDLEELRNDNKFETQYQVDESLVNGEYEVPPLIVQPLIENAILHGLKNKKGEKGVLIVSIKLTGEKLQYQITDNGIGRTASSKIPQHKDFSYGMELTKSRIKMFNHEEHPSMIIEDLYTGDIATGTRVSITLNLQTA